MDKRKTRPYGPRVFIVEMVPNGLACFFGKGRRWDWRCAAIHSFPHAGWAVSLSPRPRPGRHYQIPQEGKLSILA